MRMCDECGVGFTGDLELCPLCGTVLVGPEEPSPFPVSQVRRPERAARRALALLAAAAIAAVIGLGWAFGLTPWAVALGCVAVALSYLFLRNVVVHHPDSLRVVERYFLVLAALAVLWWLASGEALAAQVAIPTICLAACLVNAALVAVYRGRFVHGYAKYLVYQVVLGFAPLALLPLGAASWPWLAYASAASALLLTVLLLGLARAQLLSELRKLFAT